MLDTQESPKHTEVFPQALNILRSSDDPDTVRKTLVQISKGVLTSEVLDWKQNSDALISFFENTNQEVIEANVTSWFDAYFDVHQFYVGDPDTASILQGFEKVRENLKPKTVEKVVIRLIDLASRDKSEVGRTSIFKAIWEESDDIQILGRAAPIFRLASSDYLKELEEDYFSKLDVDLSRMLVLDSIVENIMLRKDHPDLISLKSEITKLVPAYIKQGLSEYLKNVFIRIGVPESEISEVFPLKEDTDNKVDPQAETGFKFTTDYQEYIKQTFQDLVDDDRSILEKQLLEISAYPADADLMRRIAARVFVDVDSSSIEPNEIYDQPYTLIHKHLLTLVKFMLKDKEKFSGPLGVISSLLPIKDVMSDPDLVKQLKETELRVKPRNGQWALCSDAEPLLLTSMTEKMYVVVNDFIVMKGLGRMSGLCIEDHLTADGYMFKKGNWYAVTDEESRRLIVSAIDQGTSDINLQSGSWARMRKLRKHKMSPSGISEFVSKQLETRPTKLPDTVRGLTRSEYRRMRSEKFIT